MTTYQVRAVRWEHGWELHVDGVGVTQSGSLADAEEMARDLISRREELSDGSFTVTISPEAPEAGRSQQPNADSATI